MKKASLWSEEKLPWLTAQTSACVSTDDSLNVTQDDAAQTGDSEDMPEWSQL